MDRLWDQPWGLLWDQPWDQPWDQLRGQLRHGVPGGPRFEPSSLCVEASQRCELLRVAEPCLAHRGFEDADGFVVDAQRHREGMAILAAESKGEAGRVAEAV